METDDEEEAVHGRADHWDPAGAGGDGEDGDLAPKHGVSDAKLKRLLADAMLDSMALKDLLSKRMVRPVAKREAVAHLSQLPQAVHRAAAGGRGFGHLPHLPALP